MSITGDTNATAIPTYRGVPLSMGDAFIKVTPGEISTTYEVSGQFFAVDTDSPFPGITGAMRKTAQEWMESVVATIGRPTQLQEIDGPLGKRLIVPSQLLVDQSPARDLVDPFAVKTHTGVYLTGVSSNDNGGRHFTVTWTFTKPSVTGDGTADGTTVSTISFLSTAIGNRGGKVVTKIGASSIDITTTSYYVKEAGGVDPLTYIQNLSETLKVNPNAVIDVPRGAPTNRSVIKTYTSGAVGSLAWTGKGSIANTICKDLSFQEDTPGVFSISGTFAAKR